MSQKKPSLFTISKDKKSVLDDWSKTSGVSKSHIIDQLIQSANEKTPDFLKPKKDFSMSQKYEPNRKDKGRRIYLREFSEKLDNFQENTGESISELVRNLIRGAINAAPELFEKRV